MGMFYDFYTNTYEGTTIEVEGKYSFIDNSVGVSLVIDQSEVDSKKVRWGTFILRGKLPKPEGGFKPVVVQGHQGLFGTKYQLQIDGVGQTLTKIH